MNKKSRVVLAVLIVMALLFTLGCGGSKSKRADSQPGSQQTFNWKLASCWPDGTFLFEVDKRFCEVVDQLSNGRLKIKAHGVGTLAPANQVFDVVQKGTVECGGDWPAYWTGKNTAFDLLATQMFGFSNWDYYIWIYEAGGQDVYNKIYGKFNMTYFPTAITGIESGIRSNKPINKIADMQGMKIRFAGLIQGKTLQPFGVTPVSIATNELYEALQRGVIDAAEYSGPYNDDIMKIQEVTKYWLVPGWHQTSSVYGVMINNNAYNKLPDDLKRIVDYAAKVVSHEYTAKYAFRDAVSADKMIKGGIKTTRLSAEEMDLLEKARTKASEDIAKENPDYAMVLKSQIDYLKKYETYRTLPGEWGFGRNWKGYPNI